MATMKLDNYDLRLLHELNKNSRMRISDLSKSLKLPKATVNFRIKRLIKRGVIRWFYSVYNVSQLGYSYSLIFVSFNGIAESRGTEIIQFLRRSPFVARLIECEGQHDLILYVLSRNHYELQNFIANLKEKYGKDLTIDVNAVVQSHHFSGDVSNTLTLQHVEQGHTELDNVDKIIIATLALGARTRLITLSQLTGTSPQVVKYRIKKLEEQNAIRGYRADINWEKLGFTSHLLFVNFNSPARAARMMAYFREKGICLSATELVGTYDVVVHLLHPTDKPLRELVGEFKRNFLEDVASYTIHTILNDYTNGWSPFSKSSEPLSRKKELAQVR